MSLVWRCFTKVIKVNLTISSFWIKRGNLCLFVVKIDLFRDITRTYFSVVLVKTYNLTSQLLRQPEGNLCSHDENQQTQGLNNLTEIKIPIIPSSFPNYLLSKFWLSQFQRGVGWEGSNNPAPPPKICHKKDGQLCIRTLFFMAVVRFRQTSQTIRSFSLSFFKSNGFVATCEIFKQVSSCSSCICILHHLRFNNALLCFSVNLIALNSPIPGADPGFPVGGDANPPGGGLQHTNFPDFRKTAWNSENLGP